MSIRLSTGFITATSTYAGVQSLMQYGVIEVYTGDQPDDADEAPTGTLLGRITQDGLTFIPGSPTGGLFIDTVTPGELRSQGTWTFNGVDTGTAGWFRWKTNAVDGGALSTTAVRVDGSIPLNMVLPQTEITPGLQFNLLEFKFIIRKQET